MRDDEFHLHGLRSQSEGYRKALDRRSQMRHVHYTVVDGLILAEIHVALKAKVWGINDVPGSSLMGQCQTEIIRGKEKGLNTAIGTAEKMIGFVQTDGCPALWTLLFDCKGHSIPVSIPSFLRNDCRIQTQAGFRPCTAGRP